MQNDRFKEDELETITILKYKMDGIYFFITADKYVRPTAKLQSEWVYSQYFEHKRSTPDHLTELLWIKQFPVAAATEL